MSRKQVLLFDAGGVLVDWVGTAGLVELTGGRLTEEQARRFWMEFELLKPFETGRADGQEFACAAIAELDLDMTPHAFLDTFDSWMRGPYPGALEMVGRIRPEYRCAVLSNSNPIHWARLIDDYGLAGPFEALFVSHELGQRKPDAAAYQTVSKHLDHPLEDFIFFDDNPECVEAARELGMQARQVRGLEQLSMVLQELGALPADESAC